MRHRRPAFLVPAALVLVLIAAAAAAGRRQTAPREEPAFRWPEGKRGALSLSFDDARRSQVDVGQPLLDKFGIKATFYVNPDGVKERLDGWKKAAKGGHEIGNHTLTHPCTGNYEFSRHNALENMTLDGIEREIAGANAFIQETLGVEPRTFAYPCCQNFVGRGRGVKSYVPMVAAMFATARMGGDDAGNDPLFCDLSQLMAGSSDDIAFDKLKPMIDQAMAEGRWLILCGHEVGPSGFQITSTATLEAVCRYAADPANGIWIDTIGRIGRYVDERRKI